MATQNFNDVIQFDDLTLQLKGATSGATVLKATSVASGTLTLPAGTDTLMGKATVDIQTNKTFDTAGTGNVLKINGTQVNLISGTGATLVLANSPSLTTPQLGQATASSLNKVLITPPANNATLTLVDGTTVTFQGSDTYMGRSTTDPMTNKTFDTAGTGNVFKINGTQISSQATLNAFAKPGFIYVALVGANLNTLADQAITIPLPTGTTLYRFSLVTLSNPSAAVTTAIGGIWSGAGKTGTTLIGTGAAGVALTGLSATGANANGNMVVLTPNNVNTEAYNYSTVFFACSTIEGAARTTDVGIVIEPLN